MENLMNAEAILMNLKNHGVEVSSCAGQLHLKARSGILTAEIAEIVRQHKQEIIDALHVPSTVHTTPEDTKEGNRWGVPPPGPRPLTACKPRLSQQEIDLVCGQIDRQPAEVYHWILGNNDQQGQADRYENVRKWPSADCDIAGALDLLLWQHGRHMKHIPRYEAVKLLIQELADTGKECQA